MVNLDNPELFFKKIEISMLILVFLGFLLCLFFSKNLIWSISFLSGGSLGYLNFRSTKKEGITFIKRVKENLKVKKNFSIEKEKNVFIFKIYLKLFATGIVLFVLISIFKLHPVFILAAFFLIYTYLILASLKYLIFNRILVWRR